MTHTRNGSFDYAKLLAACGIVWFHAAAPGASYGYAGLAFFLIVLVLFTRPAARRLDFANFAQTRATRLLLPWAVCCLLYGAIKLGEVWTTSATLETEFEPTMLFTGPALHLWFLPFAFVAGLLIYPLARLTLALPAHLRLPLAAIFTGMTVLALSQPLPNMVPWAQWVYALPPLCLGLAVMFAGGNALRQMGVIGVVTLIGLGAGWGGTLQLALAGLALVICTAFPQPATALSAKLGRLALTLYLLHPAVAAILLRLGDLGSNRVTFALMTTGITLGIALLIDAVMRARTTVATGQFSRA